MNWDRYSVIAALERFYYEEGDWPTAKLMDSPRRPEYLPTSYTVKKYLGRSSPRPRGVPGHITPVSRDANGQFART